MKLKILDLRNFLMLKINYARKITARVLINPYRSNDLTFFIDAEISMV